MDFLEAPGASRLLPGWSLVSLPFTTNDVRHIPLHLKASLKNNCVHFCAASCGGSGFLTTCLCSRLVVDVCQRMWSGPVVVCHLERMRAPYGRGRGL